MASALFKKHARRLGRFCARFSLGRISADQRTPGRWLSKAKGDE
jgi:hypothetical protein